MLNERVLWSLAAILTASAIVILIASRGQWSIWGLWMATPGPYLAYRALTGDSHCEPFFSASTPDEKDQLTAAYRSATEALASAIGAKDSYIHPLSNRAPRICELVASRLKLSESEVERIRLASLLRDVGKLGVPDYILLKPGPLDPEEFAKMRNHAAIGAKLLQEANLPSDIIDMVKHHHERHDGTGYPDKLMGGQIPLGSRIIAVAVVYDALVSDRCYRNGWSHAEAVEHIKQLSGVSFDPCIVKAFLDVEQQAMAIGTQTQHKDCDEDTRSEESSCAAIDTIAQANRELLSLFDIAQTLSSTLELDEVLALLTNRTRRLLQSSTCAVFVVDRTHTKSLVVKAVAGRFEDALKGAHARSGRGVTGKSALHMEPRISNYDPNDLMLACETDPGIDFKSCAVAPIVSYGELLGVISIYDVCPRAFSHDEVRILTFVAHQAALAIQNAKAFEEVRDSALRDPLTNLRNGRFLRHSLEREISRCTRLGEPLAVLGIDLDNFKAVNDLLGHEAGDVVLRDVANIFRHELRDYDEIVRNGGDEFVILLPGTSSYEAHQTAQRIRTAVECYAAQAVRQIPGFGASVGVASYPEESNDARSLLARADASMYRDKRSRKQHRIAA